MRNLYSEKMMYYNVVFLFIFVTIVHFYFGFIEFDRTVLRSYGYYVLIVLFYLAGLFLLNMVWSNVARNNMACVFWSGVISLLFSFIAEADIFINLFFDMRVITPQGLMSQYMLAFVYLFCGNLMLSFIEDTKKIPELENYNYIFTLTRYMFLLFLFGIGAVFHVSGFRGVDIITMIFKVIFSVHIVLNYYRLLMIIELKDKIVTYDYELFGEFLFKSKNRVQKNSDLLTEK